MRPVKIVTVVKNEIITPDGPQTVSEERYSKWLLEVGYGETILVHQRLNKAIEQKGYLPDLKSEIAKCEAHRVSQDISKGDRYEDIKHEFNHQGVFIADLTLRSHQDGEDLHSTLIKNMRLNKAVLKNVRGPLELTHATTPTVRQTWDDLRDPNVGLIETGKRIIAAQKMYLFGL